jgi:hypothetical protein
MKAGWQVSLFLSAHDQPHPATNQENMDTITITTFPHPPILTNNVALPESIGGLSIYACTPNTVSCASNNIEGVHRPTVPGLVVRWGNGNGIVFSDISRKEPSRHIFYFALGSLFDPWPNWIHS